IYLIFKLWWCKETNNAGERFTQQPVMVRRSLKFKDPCEDYKILKCIGVGAFGKVHKARNLKTGHLVAIKIQDCTNDKCMALLQECMLLESFNHQNIPKVMDKYYWEQKLYICMELCAGGDLDNSDMGTGFLKESQIAFVAKEVLETLLYLHQKGYVHRDIKPNNILLTDAGEVRLVDFGLMSRIQRRSPHLLLEPLLTCLQNLSGDYDDRCDVWSLGITLLELAEGKLPLVISSSNSLYEYWEQKQRVPHLRKRDKWSPAFHRFLKDALTLDPAMRPSVELLLQHEFIYKKHLIRQARTPLTCPVLPPTDWQAFPKHQNCNCQTLQELLLPSSQSSKCTAIIITPINSTINKVLSFCT
uniref:non-specific serine/threonine protein kinase n=1 Tax=Denticeps clupeoides TaxID=299321 RepID=A0AAY4CH66_9TELE